MEERTVQGPAEAPVRDTPPAARPKGPGGEPEAATGPVAAPAGDGSPDPLADPRALTILTTEHWSLLSGRSLIYNEAFTRASMFLTFLSASLVALALVSGGMGFGREFLLFAAALLALDLFIGLATLGRVSAVTSDDLRYIGAMNRIRHAYLEIQPGLGRYVSGGRHDDLVGILSWTYLDGLEGPRPLLGDLAHGLTTTPGMIGTITAAVGGGLAIVLVLLLGASGTVAALAGVLAFALLFAAILRFAFRTIARLERGLEVRFPSPPPQQRR